MERERVIVDIETLDQALKVEETVKTGYCDVIIENIVQWIAIEEDLKNSYDRLSEKNSQRSSKEALLEFAKASKENKDSLNHFLKLFEDFSSKKVRQIERLKALKAKP